MENAIEIGNLKKSFDGREVLSGVNLQVQKGENLVVVGRSGEGKSVTIQCIAGLLQPDEGSIKVLGQDVLALDEDELKEKISDLEYKTTRLAEL